MLLARLVATSQALAATRSRKAKIGHLASLLAEMQRDEVAVGVGFLAGEVRQGRIGVGYATVFDVEAPPAAEPSLSVLDVDHAIDAISTLSGAGSVTARRGALAALLAAATEPEQEFLRRLLLQELRQGALEGIMVEALAAAANVPAEEVRRAAMVSGDLGAVAEAALTRGAAGLAGFRLTLLAPLLPMLAQTASDVATAIEKICPAVVEAKLDGARIQAHKDGDRVELYSRNLRPVTGSLPDIVGLVASIPATTMILDGEAIALRPDGRPQPFQVTMSRYGTSAGVEQHADRRPLTVFFFDCLHLDGDDLIDLPAEERHRRMAAVVPSAHLPERRVVQDPAAAVAFYEEVLAAGHEGIMVKDPVAPYAAGRRGAAWLKVKPAHTLDLVVLAVEWGSGRRQGWLSNIHLGARDPASGGFVMLGKTFKGMTDAMLAWQTKRFLELETHRDGHVVHVRPEQVVEVAFDGILASSRYPGGLALRFARVKGYRDDKGSDEADTIDTVRLLASQGHPPN
jgi:DNA ligase-1